MAHREPDFVVDSHTHVVSPDGEAYPLSPRPLSGDWYRSHPASAEDLAAAMDASGVDAAVLVQGVGAYSYDNRYAADAAAARPTRFVSAACIDVEQPDAPDTLAYWVEERGMAGVRLFALARDGPSWLTREQTFPVWQRARALGAHVIVTILPHQLDELDQVLARFPDTPVSLDHCAFALGEPEARERLFSLAVHANLHLKVSTHNLEEDLEEDLEEEPGGDHGAARCVVETLVERFDAQRLMWGSDFCQIAGRDYGELVALARDACAGLSERDRAWLLGETACSLWPGLAAIRSSARAATLQPGSSRSTSS